MSQAPRLPEITHLQFVVLAALIDNERRGRELRTLLKSYGLKNSAPAFYQMMGRLETAVASADDSAQLSDHAALLFSRLPDELVARAPELARRVAAQIGSDNPLIMKRVIQLVGLGPLDTQATAGLAGVLSEWAQREPEVQPFLPKDPTDTRELTSATQYLLANRNLDALTANSLSGWLKTVVTPVAVPRVETQTAL